MPRKIKIKPLIFSRKKKHKHLPHVEIKKRQSTVVKHNKIWLGIASSAKTIHKHAKNAIAAIKKHKQNNNNIVFKIRS